MFWKKKKQDDDLLEVPEEWAKEIETKKQKTGLVKLKVAGPPRISLPNALWIKRKFAWLFTFLNLMGFLSSSWSLGLDGVPFFLFFAGNTILMREYLYQTANHGDRYIVQQNDKEDKE